MWPKLWYTILLIGFLSMGSTTPAQTLSVEEQLRLQVLQLQQELVQERALKLNVTASFAQCVDAKFQLDRVQFDQQYQQAVQTWLKDVEQKNPGLTWDLTDKKFKTKPKE
jgi:hypothetical protein